MNEEALEYSFNLFKADGYNGTIENYKTLIKEDGEALSYSYGLFSSDGYNGSIEDFSTLVGVGKQTDPAKETASAGSENQAVDTGSSSENGSLERPEFNYYEIGGRKITDLEFDASQAAENPLRKEDVYEIDGVKYYADQLQPHIGKLSVDQYISRLKGSRKHKVKVYRFKEINVGEDTMTTLYNELDPILVKAERPEVLSYTNKEGGTSYMSKDKYDMLKNTYQNLEKDASNISEEEITDRTVRRYFDLDNIKNRNAKIKFGEGKYVEFWPEFETDEDYDKYLKEQLGEDKFKEYKNYLEDPATLDLKGTPDEAIAKREILSENYQRLLRDVDSEGMQEDLKAFIPGKKFETPEEQILYFNTMQSNLENQAGVIGGLKKQYDIVDSKNNFTNRIESLNSEFEKLNSKYTNGINKDSDPEDIKAYNELVKSYNALQDEIESTGINYLASNIDRYQEEYMSNFNEFVDKSENIENMEIAKAALDMDYRFSTRLILKTEEFLVGGIEGLIGGIADVTGKIAEHPVINPNGIWNKGISNWATTRAEERQKYMAETLPTTLGYDDIKKGASYGDMFLEMFADNAASTALSLIPVGAGFNAVRGLKIVSGMSEATKASMRVARAAAWRTAVKKASNLTSATFFVSAAGNKFNELGVLDKNALQKKKELEFVLSETTDPVERRRILNQLDIYNRAIDRSSAAKAFTAFSHGLIEFGAEKLGTVGFISRLQDASNLVNKNSFRRALGQGRIALTGIGIENLEETATQLGQNGIDILALGDNKSLIDGINKEFFTSTTISSLAISGPSVGQNLFNIFADEVKLNSEVRNNRKLFSEYAQIQKDKYNFKNGTAARKKLLQRQNEIREEANINTAASIMKLNRLSESQIKDVFEINRKIRQESKVFDEVGALGMKPGERKTNDILNRSEEKLKALVKRKEEILGIQNRLNEDKIKSVKDLSEVDQAKLRYLLNFQQFHDDLLEINLKGNTKVYKAETLEDLLPQIANLSVENQNEMLNMWARLDEVRAGGNAGIVGNSIIINESKRFNQLVTAAKTGMTEAKFAAVAATHELLHLRTAQAGLLENDLIKANFKSSVIGLKEILAQKLQFGDISKKDYDMLISRAERYEKIDKDTSVEELINLYSDAVNLGILSINDFDINYEIKNLLNSVSNFVFGESSQFTQFKTAQDVIDYIRKFNQDIRATRLNLGIEPEAEGKLSLADSIQEKMNNLEDQLMDQAIDYDIYESKMAQLEKQLKLAEKQQEAQKPKPKKKEAKKDDTLKEATTKSKKTLDDIGNDPNGFNKNNPKIYEVLEGMIRSKSKTFRTASDNVVNLTNLPGFEMENMVQETIAGLVPMINKFDPKKNDSLFGYLNSQLANKMRGSLKSGKVTEQQFTEDVTELKGVATEEATTKQPEKPKYVKIMDADVFDTKVINNISDKMVSTVRVLKNKLIAALGKNQNTSPLIAEILSDISTQADIDIKKAMGGKKDGALRKFLLKNKQPIIENLTTTFLMGKDQGNEVLGGLPIAIQKQVDGKFLSYPEWAGEKIDRETTEKRGATAGNQIVRRVPANKISDTDYLSFFLDATGNPLRGRKEALAKELSGELGLELFVEAIESGTGPIFDAFEGNRERMGEVLGNYYAGEVIKQVERGTVKFSLSQDVIIETFRELSGRTEFQTKQNLDKLYKKYPKLRKQIEEEIVRPYKNIWKRINEIVAAEEAKDRGKAFEIAFGEMLNKVGGKITNTRINKDGVDVAFQIGKDTIKLETKLDTDAKFGSPQVFGIYDFILKDKEINFEWATEEQNYLLNEGLENMRPAFKSYVDKLLKSEGVVQEDGSILISKQAADPLYNKDKDLFEKTKTYIDLPWDIVNSWYAKNNNDIINILEIGAFNLKENPGPYSAYLPEFATYTDGVMDKGMRARGTFYSSVEGENRKIKFGFIFEIKNAYFKDKLAENGGKQINTELGLETFLGIKTKPIRQGKLEKGSKRVALSLTSTTDINVVADRQYKGQFNYDFEINGIDYDGTGFGFNMVDQAMDNTDMFIDAMSEITGVKNVKTSKYQYFVFGERDSGSTEVISREDAVWDGKKYVFPESDVKQSLNVFGSLANNFVKQAKEGKLNGIVFTGKEASRRRLYSAITIKFANQLDWNYKIISRREAAGGDIYVLGKSKFKEAPIERIKHSMKMSIETVALGNTLNPSKTTKGISVWDFDDTLATTKSNVLYTLPGGITGKLTAEEFAKQGDVLLEQGAEFDFSEFSKVMQGAKGPMFDKAIERNEKFGNENVYILTARPANSATAIHEFLKGLGLDIKLENIIGLGNSTAQAKADWVNSKVGEGYNDFYFADDAYKNVKAVQKILEVADVKSKVQQAYVKYSIPADPKILDKEFNLMLERTKGLKAGSIISPSRAEQLGKGKGRLDLFLPPNAEDFQGLLYKFLGTGKQGDADIKFFKDNLLDPFNIAENAMSTFRQNLAENLKVLKKELGNIDEDISDESIKSIQEIGFTPDQAVRVFVWNRMGQEIPDLTNQEKAKILSVVRRDASLMRYARELMKITSQFGGYPPPSKTWFAGNSTSDLYQYANENVRAKYLENWQANADAIFNKSNMTKIEAVYGKDFAKNLKEILRRMKSGSNRPLNLNDTGSKMLDYINGSVGTIMFLNMRSAVLQTISAVNFLNWHDNNIFKAGATLADPKNFVKTFMEIMNSDFLKQRRDGLEINVSEADIATAVEQSKNKAKAMFNALIKFGYKPTQFADSFAIAAGGTSFLINRTNTYVKTGMSYAEAREQAFTDFRAIAEENQQSSRTDRTSNIQASNMGRLVFAFNNTPFQMTRLFKKATLDLINGRGDRKTNISKMLYYGAIQNVIFFSLQQAFMAMLFGADEDDREDIDDRTERLFNSTIDSILRGSGLPGAVISTAKNVIMEYAKQEAKGEWRADHGKTLIAALNFSPPLGSKASRIYSALKGKKYEKTGFDTLRNQSKIISAITNIPVDRTITKIDNLRVAASEPIETWKRLALFAGWDQWSLGVYDDLKTIEDKQKGKEKEKSRSEIMKEVWRKRKEEDKNHRDSIINTFRKKK
jgi:hypothetical protein